VVASGPNHDESKFRFLGEADRSDPKSSARWRRISPNLSHFPDFPRPAQSSPGEHGLAEKNRPTQAHVRAADPQKNVQTRFSPGLVANPNGFIIAWAMNGTKPL